ncbi:MAG TPA: SDR family oxidoreductase [Puia sp.]|jgi:NAD(P)-dependent dehydrogenase (short-subunit alcohol dehydrogenase family)
MYSLKNKTAVVTGGGSGIGKAICQMFALAGARVFILDIDEHGSEETVDQIRKTGGQAEFLSCAVDQESAVQKAINHIVNIQVPDILVNNAGIAHIGTAENTSAADFEKLFSVNVKGVYHMVRNCIPHMKEKGGVILNMASIAAQVGLPDRFAYSMTKGAVMSMTLSIAKDYIRYNIRCNSISPARVHTPFVDGFIAKNYAGMEEEMFRKLSASQPVGRMARPEEIAALALYLCSDEASFITGNDYPIDGGFLRLNG